jgi:hypothetical protein
MGFLGSCRTDCLHLSRLCGMVVAMQPLASPASAIGSIHIFISIVMIVRNEATALPATEFNGASELFPDPAEIVVVSDGSSDGTNRFFGPAPIRECA